MSQSFPDEAAAVPRGQAGLESELADRAPLARSRAVGYDTPGHGARWPHSRPASARTADLTSRGQFLRHAARRMLMTEEGETRKIGPLRIPRRIQRISWRDLAASLGPVLLVSVVAIWIAVHFVRPAPPDTIIITSGPEGSIGQTTAEKYRKILVRNGVKLEILPSEGSLENLQRLADPKFK